jgi:pimeloyl-ACP methyl ester carboxylesterase
LPARARETTAPEDNAPRPVYVAPADDLVQHVLGGVGPNPVRTVDGGKPLQLVNPDLSAFYRKNIEWLESVVSRQLPISGPVSPLQTPPSYEPCEGVSGRKALQLWVDGHRLFGTYHQPAVALKERAVGILFLSFGQQPRSWVGDLGSYAADRLCDLGYPIFRFDMPGLGDSPGELPIHLEVLWRSIQEGAHKSIAQALIRELRTRFSLRGLIVAGFCGGAVTAVYAADQKNKDVLGLILLEPEIALTPITTAPRPEQEIDSAATFWSRWQQLLERVRSPQAWMRLLSGKSDLSYWRGISRYLIRRIEERRRGQKLPPETNRPLFEIWQRLHRQKLPRLVLSAGLPARKRYYRSYGMGTDSTDPKSDLTWIEIAGTTHAMLAGGAKESVPAYMEKWIQERTW